MPTAQLVQCTSPVMLAYFPAAHDTHALALMAYRLDCPRLIFEYLPVGQAVQSTAPASAYLPDSQFWHSTEKAPVADGAMTLPAWMATACLPAAHLPACGKSVYENLGVASDVSAD